VVNGVASVPWRNVACPSTQAPTARQVRRARPEPCISLRRLDSRPRLGHSSSRPHRVSTGVGKRAKATRPNWKHEPAERHARGTREARERHARGSKSGAEARTATLLGRRYPKILFPAFGGGDLSCAPLQPGSRRCQCFTRSIHISSTFQALIMPSPTHLGGSPQDMGSG
jgi:hypothetical protein